MAGLGDLLAWIDNKKRVAGRNLSDLVQSPRDFESAAAARLDEDLSRQFSDPEQMMDFVNPLGAIGSISLKGALSKLVGNQSPKLDELRMIGREFAARSPEEYFAKYKSPARSIEEASKQYGVDIYPRPESNAIHFGEHRARLGTAEDFLNELTKSRDASKGASVASYLRTLDPKSTMYSIDSMGSGIGSGAGGATYPAMFDILSGEKGLMNVPTGLTGVNEFRRSVNTGDALMRNEALTGKIIPHDVQLKPLGFGAESYMRHLPDRESQIGAMQLAAAIKGADRFGQVGSRIDEGLIPEQYVKGFRDIQQLDRFAPAEEFDRLGTGLKDIGLGPGSLKKMAIIDALLGGKQFNQDLWKDLGKKKGGLHQCSCGH